MICAEFELKLTDYLENDLEGDAAREVAAHSLSCPLCHQLLDDVRDAVGLLRVVVPESPLGDLNARIVEMVTPELIMSCDEFEESLTDYLDGYLPAPLFHRWERHAATCLECTELPGIVVRSIGACYATLAEPLEVPHRLHQSILQSTLGTVNAADIKPSIVTTFLERLRLLLDPIVSPQLATVATMILIAVLVLTSTVSADGSLGGMYRASIRLAEETYKHGEATAKQGEQIKNDIAGIVMKSESETKAPENSNGNNGSDKK